MQITRRQILLPLATLPLFTPSILRSEEHLLRFRVSGSLPRSAYIEGEGWQGFEADMMRRVVGMALPKRKLEFVENYKWGRALKSLRYGEIDLMSGVSFRRKRTKYFDYIGAFDTEEVFLVTRSDTEIPALDSIDSLTSLPGQIQVNFEAVWHPEFDERLKSDPKFREFFSPASGAAYNSHEEFIRNTTRRIRLRRVDGAILTYYTAIKVKNFPENKDHPENPMKITRIGAFGAPVTFLVSSRMLDSGVRRELREAYKKTRIDGSFDEIWRRWYGDRQIPVDREV